MRRLANDLTSPSLPMCALALVITAGVAGCGEDELPVRTDLQYQVRCGGSLGCSGEPIRPHADFEGERRFEEVSCFTSNGEFSFFVRSWTEDGDEYSLRVRRVGSADCEVTLVESGNDFRGSCSNAAPPDTIPCHISFSPDGDSVSGSIHCNQIPQRNNATYYRNVTAVGGTGAATFTFENCS